MKKYLPAILITLTSTPLIASAQSPSFQLLFTNVVKFIGSTLIPFLFGIAFLMFVINVVRYFVIGGGNEEARENAKNIATYSVAAFVFLVLFWGLVNMLVGSIGLGGVTAPTPDYGP
jgi:hypothetical protein